MSELRPGNFKKSTGLVVTDAGPKGLRVATWNGKLAVSWFIQDEVVVDPFKGEVRMTEVVITDLEDGAYNKARNYLPRRVVVAGDTYMSAHKEGQNGN